MLALVLNCFFPVIESDPNRSAAGDADDDGNDVDDDDDGNLLGRETLRSMLATN